MNNTPRNIFVLKIANISRPFDTLYAKICVIIKTDSEKINKNSNEKLSVIVVIIINQNVSPAVTVADLKRGEEICILNRIYEGNKT